MTKRNFPLAVLLFLCLAALAMAQGTTSRLVGTVTDATGGVVPGATVMLTSQATGVSFTAMTSEEGTYVFEAVQVGLYTVTVEMQGFKKFVAADNRVNIGAPTTVNAILQVGTTSETVTVTGAYEVVQTSTSGNIGAIIEQRVLQDLPIVGTRGRNPLGLVNTEPGVVSGANTGGGVHVHGARDRAWNFTLDGIDTNETSAGGGNFSPLRTNPDSLAEFRVITSNPTAEFGRNSGAQVAMVTRSGGNELHGSAFWFYRTPRFNANEWENNINGVGKRQFVQNIPGFSLGGPIIKNRTFFFTNIQWLRARESAAMTRTVYTADARKGLFRYVKGGRNTPAGATGASVDASGNVLAGVNLGTYNVAASDPAKIGLDATVQKIIALTPLPNNFMTGDGLNTAGFNFAALQYEKQHDVVFKIDHAFSSKNVFFARVAWGRQDTLCDRVNGGDPAFPGLTCRVNTQRDPKNVALNWRWNPTPRITNELVVGGNQFAFDFVIPQADASKPYLSLNDITIPESTVFGNKRMLRTYQIVENFSYLRGAHAIKAGANIRFQQHEDTRGSVAGVNIAPQVNFSTATNTVDPTTFGIPTDINTTFDRPLLQRTINNLLGRVGSASQGFVSDGEKWLPGGTPFIFDARYPEWDFYVQDTWKIRKNLTVDLGLRLELKMNPRNPQGLIYRPNQTVTVGAAPSNTLKWVKGDLYKNDTNNWAPSIGVAWDPSGAGKSSIRANYRLAYDRINTFVLSSTIYQSMPGLTLSVVEEAFGQGGGRLASLPKIAPAATVLPSNFVQPDPAGARLITVVDPDFRSPKTNMWSLSYQREVWNRTVAEVTYVGRRGVGLYGAYNINQALWQKNGFLEAFNIVKAGGESTLMNQLLLPDTRRLATETGSAMVRRLFTSTLNLNSVASLANSIGTRIQSGKTIPELAGFGPYFLNPFPQFLSGLNVIDANDYSTYHALELKLDRQFSDGISFMGAYTFAKSLDTRSFDPAFIVVSTANAQSASSTPFDIYNRRLNYARSDFDRTHVVQARWLYELPIGKNKRFSLSSLGRFIEPIVSGWQLSSFMTIQTGRPMTVYSGANTYSSVVQTPANCTGCSRNLGMVFDDTATGLKWYFNDAERGKFTAPGAGEFGSTGRNYFQGPGSFNMDLGILKRTYVRESHYLEFRAEFTNLTNTPTFGFPTLTTTSSLFGRIRDGVISGSRKMQVALKYTF